MKDKIIIVLAIILTNIITVASAYLYTAEDIEYKPSSDSVSATNVQSAINQLYDNSISVSELKELLKNSKYDLTKFSDRNSFIEYFNELNSNILPDIYSFTRGYPSNTASDLNTIRTFNMNTYIVGIAADNYFRGTMSSFSIADNKIITKTCAGYGLGFVTSLGVGKSYKITFDASTSKEVFVSFYNQSGKHLSYVRTTTNELNFTVPSSTYYSIIIFNSLDGNCTTTPTVTYSNIKLYQTN